MKSEINETGHFLVYDSEDGEIKIDVRIENETVWLTQQLMAELFQTTQQNISQHIIHIYKEGCLNLRQLTRYSCQFVVKLKEMYKDISIIIILI